MQGHRSGFRRLLTEGWRGGRLTRLSFAYHLLVFGFLLIPNWLFMVLAFLVNVDTSPAENWTESAIRYVPSFAFWVYAIGVTALYLRSVAQRVRDAGLRGWPVALAQLALCIFIGSFGGVGSMQNDTYVVVPYLVPYLLGSNLALALIPTDAFARCSGDGDKDDNC